MKRILRATTFVLAVLAAPAAWSACPPDCQEEAKLLAASLTGGEESGRSVSISGNTAVVGAPSQNGGAGAVYIFDFETDPVPAWVPYAGNPIVAGDAAAGDGFGTSVSIHGDNLAVGAPNRGGGNGGVYSFKRTGLVWAPDLVSPLLTPTAAGGRFGQSVSIETDLLAIGAPFEQVGAKVAQGVVYAYARDGLGAWTIAPNSGGQRIAENKGNARAGDHIGWSVSLSGNTILAGAPGDDQGNKTNKGSSRVYVSTNNVWSRQVRLNPNTNGGDEAGISVSLFSNGAAVGVPGRNGGRGGVITYTRNGTNWTETASITAPDAAAGDHLGAAVSRAGPVVIAGAPQASSSAGKTYIFGNNAFVGNLEASDNAAGDAFGTSTSFDSGRALVGAPGQDEGGSNAGAGYVFGVIATTTTTITSDAPDPSNAGSAYTVSVTVAPAPPVVVSDLPTVDVSDGDGATCSFTLDAGGQGSCQLTSNAPGSKTLSAAFNGTATFGASQTTEPHEVIGGDLAVSIDDGTDKIVAGETKVYNIVVSNPGDFAAVGVQVINNMPAELQPGSATWTCTPGVGGTCPLTPNGTGNIDELVDLLPGGSVTFAVTVTVVDPLDPQVVLFVDNTASINPGLNADLNPDNNTFTDTDDTATDGVFSDSFEGDPPPP